MSASTLTRSEAECKHFDSGPCRLATAGRGLCGGARGSLQLGTDFGKKFAQARSIFPAATPITIEGSGAYATR
jgi:hypothetical protein